MTKMLQDLKSALHRSSGTLLQDFFGAGALVLMLVIGLHLPALT